MLYQFFFDFENSQIIQTYLVNHKEIEIATIKNTKLVFHEIIHKYILSMAKSQIDNTLSEIDKEGLLMLIDETAETLKQLAIEQEQVLKLPSIEEMRDPNLLNERLKKEQQNANK